VLRHLHASLIASWQQYIDDIYLLPPNQQVTYIRTHTIHAQLSCTEVCVYIYIYMYVYIYTVTLLPHTTNMHAETDSTATTPPKGGL
jgi:hypothetical protein